MAATRALSPRWRLLAGSDGRRLVLGLLLLLLILFGQRLYGMVTASGQLDPALRGASGRSTSSWSSISSPTDFTTSAFPNMACSPAATARSTGSACAW